MIPENLIAIFIILFGLYSIIKFKALGKSTIEHRRKFEEMIGSPKSKRVFNKNDVVVAQIMTLIGGIIFSLVGVGKLLNLF